MSFKEKLVIKILFLIIRIIGDELDANVKADIKSLETHIWVTD
jgi:hypothetical protein